MYTHLLRHLEADILDQVEEWISVLDNRTSEASICCIDNRIHLKRGYISLPVFIVCNLDEMTRKDPPTYHTEILDSRAGLGARAADGRT